MSTNPQDGSRPTVVLVHGAFADGSSWNGVIERLQAEGVRVTAPANPLRGISIDSAYIASYLDQIHSSAVDLIGGTGMDRSEALQALQEATGRASW